MKKVLAKYIRPGDRVVSAAGHECLVVAARRGRFPNARHAQGVFISYEGKDNNNEECVIEIFVPLRLPLDIAD